MSPNCHVVSAPVGGRTVEGRVDRSRLEEDGYVVVHDVPAVSYTHLTLPTKA